MKHITESELTNPIKEHLQVNLEPSNINSSYSKTLDALTIFFLAHFFYDENRQTEWANWYS